ncbi:MULTISPECIES: LecA/PA-IL family lectin [Enterobacter]|uniref:LecA/PA-IL family lectin n=1 Tax=Enterobacter TaxID=547 RepID=UPI002A83B788|nr:MULTISPECIES: LecA/PA-IL family lectin [unclassified Enterobacter]
MNNVSSWSGKVYTDNPLGTSTEIEVQAGQYLTVLAKGWAKYGKEEYAIISPQGRIPRYSTDLRLSKSLLLVVINDIFQPVEGYLYKWLVPVSGVVKIVFSDNPDMYTDNTGFFDVEIYIED